ncbi:MAG: ATP-binding cassette domain-containing protein [Candidatus Pararuminococcus gallinarum]|jgi:osmoprotectant transport system ATP-binding protein
MQPFIEFQHVRKQYEKAANPIIEDLSFTVKKHDFVTVLGSSGSGKTTILKMINRLIEPTDGKILLDGQDIMKAEVNALRRRIGYVIQQIGLFPHLTAKENIALLPRCLKQDKDQTDKRVDELLSLVQLEPKIFRDRYPRQLSGGQQQRVGIARALINHPDLLLFDEPFGALDVNTRSQLQKEILEIHRQLGTTVLFVTHDLQEAFSLGDKVMIVEKGKIQRYDSPQKILLDPSTNTVGTFAFGSTVQRMMMLKPLDIADSFVSGDKGPSLAVEGITMDHIISIFIQQEDVSTIILTQDGLPTYTIRRSKILGGEKP